MTCLYFIVICKEEITGDITFMPGNKIFKAFGMSSLPFVVSVSKTWIEIFIFKTVRDV